MRILVVHQSAELYGSDRSLLDLLEGLSQQEGAFEFVVCLPEEGPLRALLAARNIETHVVPLVKVSRAMFRLGQLIRLPAAILAACRAIDGAIAGRTIDLVYTNTLAVLAGAFWAARHHVPHVWHVREIILRPPFVSKGFRIMARRMSRRVVCNSGETLAWLRDNNAKPFGGVVVWNGVQTESSCVSADEKRALKAALGLPAHQTLVLLVGRINAWKGQDLLVDAVNQLQTEGLTDFQVILVGSPPPERPEYLDRLERQIEASAAAARIAIHAFTHDVSRYYRAADILVVPSREPEPFGRVAIEGMAVGLPVIAAAHGGLKEIVVHEQTGLLVAPNQTQQLADAMRRLLASAPQREAMGRAAVRRQVNEFSVEAYRRAMAQQFEDVVVQA